ncbi:hypothetical protein V2J09_019038 [Rumex salicifolius]
MAGRNYHRELPSQSRSQQPSNVLSENALRRRGHPQHHSSAIEDRVSAFQRELQLLLLENQRLAATHVALKQELSSTHQDLRHLAAISQKIKAERDAEVREVLERSIKVEAEFRTVEAFKGKLKDVREDVEKLGVEKEELGAQLNVVNGEIERTKLELGEVPEIRAEMESIAQDIEKGRAALEVERKNRKINDEHGQSMERNMLSMTQEINRLRAELANAEKRTIAAVAVANPVYGYGNMYASSGMVYGGGSYPVQYPMHQGHGTLATPHYGQGPIISAPQENGHI